MSGIAGIIRWDGEDPAPGLIRQMAEGICHRGADGISYWEQGNSALAYLHLSVTPESFHEAQPLPNIQGSILVADARIDNRRELLERLGLGSEEENRSVPDSCLILAAYEKWRTECLDYLIGDFAFVIWTPATQTLFCARDHSGVRPLYYHYVPGKYFLFASEIKSLWTFDGLKKEIDDSRVANYLCHWGQFNLYQQNTFFKGVASLPPAHRLITNGHSLAKEIYWNIDPARYQFESEEAYIAAFKETFVEAVRCRIRTPFPVSSFLSGGLDSSSVAAVASTLLNDGQRQLDTYHIDTELAETSEKKYVVPFLDRYEVNHRDVVAGKDYYQSLQEVAAVTDMPEMFSVTYNHFTPILREVAKRGSRVLLTGSDGDTVVGYGTEYIYQAIQRDDWQEAARLFNQAHDPRAYAEAFGKTEGKWVYSQRMIGMLLGKLPTLFSRPKARWHFIKGTLLYLKIPPLHLLRIFLKKIFRRASTPDAYAIHPDLPACCVPFMRESPTLHPTTNLLIDRGMLYQMMTEVGEYYDMIGARHQVQICHPFFDKRLIELCMFIPSKLKFYVGYGRGPLREAMRGLLPDEIRERKGKIDFGPAMNQQLVDQTPDFHEVIRDNEALLEGYIVKNHAEATEDETKKANLPRLYHRIIYFLSWRKAQKI